MAECIIEPMLLKAAFDGLSVPQQMCVKAIYGLPLNEAELLLWSAFNGFGEYDELGYVTGVSQPYPYVPQEYADVTLVLGRRSGKSSHISAFCLVYEALFGGHKARVKGHEDPFFYQIAQDLDTARENLRQHIVHLIESSPVGAAELKKAKKDTKREAITADMVRLPGGVIVVGPPTIKLRGKAVACAAMDELAVWPKERDSSNPDFEVQRAVEPALAQFYPFDKIIKTSTPWTEDGLLWRAATSGTGGRLLGAGPERDSMKRQLVLQAPTAAMQNPRVSRAFLAEKKAKDVDAFSREYLSRFSKAISGFLSPKLLRATVDPGVRLRPPAGKHAYVAALDPAFKKDAFAFAIGHLEGGVYVLDFIESWRGSHDRPISPTVALAAVANVCRTYGIKLVTSDQYHVESLQELAISQGLVIDPCHLTAKLKFQMWGDFQGMLHRGSIKLLDRDDLINELSKMERELTAGGSLRISGKSDDLATVVALNVYRALQYGEKAAPYAPPVKTLPEQIRERVVRQQGNQAQSTWWMQ